MFHQRHKCLPFFSIKNNIEARENIEFLIFCTAAVLGLLEASRKNPTTGHKIKKRSRETRQKLQSENQMRKTLGKTLFMSI